MPGSKTTPGRPGARAFPRPSVLPSALTTASAPGFAAFAAQWLAYALPYRRFACTLAGACARLGADAVRYSFIVVDSHHLLLAGFPAHCQCRSRASGGIRVRRREFIALAGGVAPWAFAVRAQQPVMPVIGYFSGRSSDAETPIRVPFLEALEGLGFATGRNIAIEFRFAKGQDERLADLAAELVRGGVAMLVATDRHGANLLRPATS
jgi:hypothetical protein